MEIGFPSEYAASASAGTVEGPFVPVSDEFVVEFGRPCNAAVELDGVGS